MNTKDELKKALAPFKLEVLNFSDLELPQCSECGWNPAEKDEDLCEDCMNKEASEELKELNYDYCNKRGA